MIHQGPHSWPTYIQKNKDGHRRYVAEWLESKLPGVEIPEID